MPIFLMHEPRFGAASVTGNLRQVQLIFFSISEGIESVKYEKSVACYRKNLYHTARSKEWLPAIGIEKINCNLDAVLFGHFSISVVHEIHEDSELIRW